MPISAEACNRCNNVFVAKTGYCCNMIMCRETCFYYGNPDKCNEARDPSDAFKVEDDVVPLIENKDAAERAKRLVENPNDWEDEPISIDNAKQYGTIKPGIVRAVKMNKQLEKDGKI